MIDTQHVLWGVLWNPKDEYGDDSAHLIHRKCIPVLFSTKKKAKEWIDKEYGYIKNRKDLRSAPHNWRLPKPRKVVYHAI